MRQHRFAVSLVFGLTISLFFLTACSSDKSSSSTGNLPVTTAGASGTHAAAGATGVATNSAGTTGVTMVGGQGGTTATAGGKSGSTSLAGTGGQGPGGGSGGAKAGAGGTTAGTSAGGTSAGTSGQGAVPGGGTCTASKAANATASGSGPHKVVVETNSDSGIKEGTIFRPVDLGGAEKYPIFAWGEGGCSQNGLGNAAVMGEIASHGYFVIADGLPNGTGMRSMGSDTASMGKPLLAYIDWAIAENDKPCSAYYQSLDTKKIATNGFSCGGLMAEGTAGDPRVTTWGLNSSGLFAADQPFYKTIHTPVLIVLGGSNDIAYTNGERDYDNISALGMPIMLFSKNGSNHGGDLMNGQGDFGKIDIAWLNWWLKGDETATGKGVLVGSTCKYCTDSTWEVKSKNIP
jgi:hypothetical protein